MPRCAQTKQPLRRAGTTDWFWDNVPNTETVIGNYFLSLLSKSVALHNDRAKIHALTQNASEQKLSDPDSRSQPTEIKRNAIHSGLAPRQLTALTQLQLVL
jgi:hypothetical protein